MTNQNSRIDIRISSKEKELIFNYCKESLEDINRR